MPLKIPRKSLKKATKVLEVLKASIDLGTNTCLLLVCGPGGVIADRSSVVRLGEGVDRTERLGAEPMARTLARLREYAREVASHGIAAPDVVCVATSQSRDAQNSGEFFAQVQKELGFRFVTLSGEEEASATFSGALLDGMNPESTAVIDIGGGSTEITWREGGGLRAVSADLGSVRFSERFFMKDGVFPPLPVSDEAFWACQEAIDLLLERHFAEIRPWFGIEGHSWVAVAGTATTLAAWHLGLQSFDPSAVDQVVLTRGDLHRMVEDLKWRTRQERLALPCMDPGRADVILAGAMILWRAHELLGVKSCRVSTRGLRYGVLK